MIFKKRKYKYRKEKEEQSLLKIKLNESKKENKLEISRKIIYISLVFLFIIISTIYLCYKNKKYYIVNSVIKDEKILEYYKNNNCSGFEDLLPRTSLNNNTVPYLYEIFNSRELFINNNKMKRKYIEFIRPINETEEIQYQIKQYDVVNLDNNTKRKDEYDYLEFAKICLEEKLIDSNNFNYENKPLISIIVSSHNNQDFLLKSIRSIQNQNFKNIEIIIVNDCSTDNSSEIYKYLLESDPRIRIFHHLKNMGLWRTQIDGILYSQAKYILFFDAGDLYNDNYILNDTYNIIDKYKLDSVKFIFRKIFTYKKINESQILFKVPNHSQIIYEPHNIKDYNDKIFNVWGNIWNRLTRANIYIKGLLLLNDYVLDLYKNVWQDKWLNNLINKVSKTFYIYDRIGYIYLQDGSGVGSPKSGTEKEKDSKMREYLGFLYFYYNFEPERGNKASIVEKIRYYNKTDNNDIQLYFVKTRRETLNDLLNLLINDPYVNENDKDFLKKLLEESKQRELLANKTQEIK